MAGTRPPIEFNCPARGYGLRAWFERGQAITTDFTYVRWLGDRKGIEEKTDTGNENFVDRRAELLGRMEACRAFLKRKI